MIGFLLAGLGFTCSFLTLASISLFALLWLTGIPEQTKVSWRTEESFFKDVKKRGLWGLYLGTVLRWTGTVGSYSLIYVYMDTLGIPLESMGMVSALGPAMSVLGMLFFGRIADLVGKKRVFLIGFGFSVSVPFIVAFAQDAWGMAGGFLALGMSSGSVYIGATAYISDITSVERQGMMLGFFEASRGLGGVLGPLVAGATVPFLGFRGMYLTMMGVIALGFFVVLFSSCKPLLYAANDH
jgi:MFS family permease